MARHAIFNELGNVLYLAESDAEKNNLSNKAWPAYPTAEISDQLFDDVAHLQKIITLQDGSVVETATNYSFATLTAEEQSSEITKKVADQSDSIKLFISSNPDNEELPIWQDYLSKLEAIDVDTLDLPISNNSFQQWFNQQPGYPQKKFLQLP